MTDNDLVLSILSDQEPHSLDEIETLGFLRKGRRITVHSRVADLRKKGWNIRAFQVKRRPGYRLIGQEEGSVRVRSREMPPVQGYTFTAYEGSEKADRDGTICQIVSRAQETDYMLLELGPAFYVKWGDGFEDVAYASELNPWYPT